MSKYLPLWIYIKENKTNDFIMNFIEIEKILGFSIDHSFLSYKKELLNYGFTVNKISLREKKTYFTKIN